MHLTVDPDGRVAVPGGQPGQTVTVEFTEEPKASERLTLATARTAEERDQVIEEILRAGRQLRQELSDEEIQIALNHGDWLYDENGLPK